MNSILETLNEYPLISMGSFEKLHRTEKRRIVFNNTKSKLNGKL